MSKIISAGVGERMQYIAHKYNDTTIRFILKYPGFLDPDILCAATRAVIDSVDVLHASFTANRWLSRWRVHTDYQSADFFALADCDGDPSMPAQSIALQPIGHKDKCQMHVTLVNGAEACSVVVRISHLVVDGSDGKYLLNKIAESYRLIEQRGNANSLDVKNGSRSAMCAYKKIGIKKLATLNKTPFTGVKTDYPFADPNAHGERRMLSCTIPASILGKAAKKAKAEGATINDLLLTACYRSYAQITGQKGVMSISAMMDLRQHCQDGTSEGLANMSGGMSTVFEPGPGRSFTDDLRSVAAQTSTIKEDPLAGLAGIPLLHAAIKIFPVSLLLRAADKVYSNMSLSLTNLGSISGALLTMSELTPTEGLFGGPLKRKPSVQVGAISFDGTAELTILGDFMTEDLDSLQAFLDKIRAEIECY